MTTLVQGLGKTETNAPKLKKFTKENIIKFVDLYELYVQDNVRERMVDLIAPTSFGYAALLSKMTKDQLKMTSDADFIEIVNKKFSMEMQQDIGRYYSPLQ